MPTLSLFRHAKSSWDNSLLRDRERPLAPRGVKASRRMGRYIRDEGLLPDLILCSGAVRTRETLDLAGKAWNTQPEIRYEDGLYLASVERMLEMVRSADAETSHLMLIGHNPGFQQIALLLQSAGDPGDLARLEGKFPTAALAVFSFEGSWQDLEAHSAKLDRFVLPRELSL